MLLLLKTCNNKTMKMSKVGKTSYQRWTDAKVKI